MKLIPFIGALWGLVRAATPGDGRLLEHDARELLISLRLRSDHVPGGYSLLGIGSASGLWHQVDLEAHLDDAVLVGELKAHRGTLPKNEVLRFVGATDDLHRGRPARSTRIPMFRAVVGTFSAPHALRTYAAMHGVVIVEPGRVPAPVLASRSLAMPEDFSPITDYERVALCSLFRPMHNQLERGSSRRWDPSMYRFGIRLQEEWSARLLSATAAQPSVASDEAAA